MGAGYDGTQQLAGKQSNKQKTIQTKQIQLDQHDQLPQALIDQQERERQEQMRREQRLVPKTGVKAKTKRLFTGKTREKAFGVTEKEVNDHFSEERSQAFIRELQREVEEDMRKTYHKGFHKVLKKIGEYVKCVRAEASYDDQQSAFREVTDAIQDYQKRYPEPTNRDAEQKNQDAEQKNQDVEQKNRDEVLKMGRERIKMYQLYFDTITNGSLEVPAGQELRYTQDAGKKLKMNTSMSSLSYDYDASKECLFPHEPKVGDIRQRGLGDCYLLAGLASLVKDHPSFIKESMKDDGNGHVTVRFFKKGYDRTDELPKEEKDMLLEAQTSSELQTMQPKVLILKLLTSLSNDLLKDMKFVNEHDDISFIATNKAGMEGLKYENAHKGEANVEQKKKELVEKADLFMKRMSDLTLDNVPALCKLAERLAQNPVFVETIVKAVQKEKDVNEALKKGYSLMADSLLDSDNPLHQEITSLSEKLAEQNEPETIPIYVTVDKKVPRVMGADLYAANSLWVSMIERAYAASGLHERELREPESASDKAAMENFLENEKKILLKQENPKLTLQEVDYLLAKKQKAYMEDYRRSYNHIEGGHTSTFLEALTGIARQDHSMDDMFENGLRDVSQAKRVTESVTKRMAGAIAMALHQDNKEHEQFISFLLRSFENDFTYTRLQKLYDSRLNRITESDLVNHFCKLENWVEKLPEKMKQYQLDKKTLETIENKLRENLPQYIEMYIERGLLKAQYDPMSGRYTERAAQEYGAIENALRNHIPVSAATIEFKGGSSKGLNGEPVEGGLVGNHAYAIVGVKEMDGKKFVKMRNPWRAGDTGYVKCTKPGENPVFERVQYNASPFSALFRQKDQGTFYLELNDFILNVARIYFNSDQAVTA